MTPDLLHFDEDTHGGKKRVTLCTSHIAAVTQQAGSNIVVIHMSSGLHVETTKSFDKLLALLDWTNP